MIRPGAARAGKEKKKVVRHGENADIRDKICSKGRDGLIYSRSFSDGDRVRREKWGVHN